MTAQQQAFPGERQISRAGYVTQEREPVPGMTLHDYFAAHAPAMPEQWGPPPGAHPDAILAARVEWARIYADSMFKARGAA